MCEQRQTPPFPPQSGGTRRAVYYLCARTMQCCVWLVKSVSDRACTLSLKPGGARPLYGKRTKRISWEEGERGEGEVRER